MILWNVGTIVLNYASEHLKVCKFKNEIVLVQNMTAYNVNGSAASLIFNLSLEGSKKRAILRICINIQKCKTAVRFHS